MFREPLVARAFSLSRSAHDGQYRASGDPAFLHCVAVARILAAMGANEVTVAAALLHDVLDNTRLLEGQLRDMVGNDTVVDVVKQVMGGGGVHMSSSPGWVGVREWEGGANACFFCCWTGAVEPTRWQRRVQTGPGGAQGKAPGVMGPGAGARSAAHTGKLSTLPSSSSPAAVATGVPRG